MSWWERSSPVQFARMTPRARMLAGLAGMGMGNAGIEERGKAGILTSLITRQSASMPGYVSGLAILQPQVQMPVQVQPGPSSPSGPLPGAPSERVFAPVNRPTAPAGSDFMTSQDQTNLALRQQTASPASDSNSRYAAGGPPPLDLYPGVPEQAGGGSPEAVMDDGGGSVTNTTSGGAATPSKKPPSTNDVVKLPGGTTTVSVPTWVWYVGGAALGLVVLYKVAK